MFVNVHVPDVLYVPSEVKIMEEKLREGPCNYRGYCRAIRARCCRCYFWQDRYRTALDSPHLWRCIDELTLCGQSALLGLKCASVSPGAKELLSHFAATLLERPLKPLLCKQLIAENSWQIPRNLYRKPLYPLETSLCTL
jgi:hypothetical protein